MMPRLRPFFEVPLSCVGREEEALEPARQALELYERLAKNNQDRFEPNYATTLRSYAVRLSDAGRGEEALVYSNQALSIHERLAEKNPDRFGPNHATSLGNHAGHLCVVGRTEEALEPALRALEINKKIAQTSPARFEPDYATSLSNYAGVLSDVGRNQEALEHSRQALEIFQRLAQKTPTLFHDDCVATVCHTQLKEWLADDTCGKADMEKLQFLPESASPHHLPVLNLYARFVQACRTPDNTGRAEAFKQVTSMWGDFSTTNKIKTQGYLMCAAAWQDKHGLLREDKTDWMAEWHQFTKKRQKHVPCWMLEVACRLKFEWPE